MNPEPPPADRTTWPKAVPLLVLAGLLAYANSFTKAFVLDDIAWIVINPDIGDASRFVSLTDRPVVKVTLWLNYRFGRLNPAGYHAVNLAAHVLAGLALCGLVRRVLLLPRFAGRYDGTAPYLAFAVALLWLVHPLQTMAVTYVIQRAESMMGLFYLFAFYAWVRGATGGGRWWYWAGVGSFVLSSGCKPVAVTLPVVLLVFDRVFLARSWRELMRERWPQFVVLFALWAVIALRPAVVGAFRPKATTGVGFGVAIAPAHYLFTQSEVILHYLRLAVLPVGQSFDYQDWPIATSFAQVWPAFLAVSGLLAGSLALLYFRPAAGFVGFWFFALLAPTSSVMPIIDPAFEYRVYLSLASVAVAVVFGAHALLERLRWPEHTRTAADAVALGLVAVVLVSLTHRRNETYRSELAVWQAAAAARPNNPRPLLIISRQYINAGDYARAQEAIQRAEAITAPSNFLLLTQKAAVAAAVGQSARAEVIYKAVTETDFNRFVTPQLMRNLAWVLVDRGKTDEAATLLRGLIENQPHVAENHLNLAAVELAAGRPDAAREAAERAARLDPNYPQRASATARARVLAAEDGPATYRKPQSLWMAAAACLADRDRDPRMLDTLAMAYAWHGRFPEAADAARRGIAAAEARADEDWAVALRERLKLYEAGKPYAKPTPAAKPK